MNSTVKLEENDHLEPSTSKPATRGVLRLHTERDSSEASVNNAIKKAVRDLARQGRRIASTPKRLQDGIAIDWVYDITVKSETTEKALSRVIPGLKHESHTSAGSSVINPISLLDSDDDEVGEADSSPSTRSTSEPTRTHGKPLNPRWNSLPVTTRSNGRRLRSESLSGGQFAIPNVPASLDVATLLQIMIDNGISEEAILDVRIRDTPGGRAATVYANSGFDAADLERRLRSVSVQGLNTARHSPCKNRHSEWQLKQAKYYNVSDRLALDQGETVDDIAAPPADIDEDIPMEDSAEPAGTQRSAEPDAEPLAGKEASPALSYMTLEEDPEEHYKEISPGNPDEHDSSHGSPVSHASESEKHADPEEGYPQSTVSSLSSSDQEDTDDDDAEPQKPAVNAWMRHPEEDLAERLLHGPLEAVQTLVQNTPEARRRMQMLHERARATVAEQHPNISSDSDDLDVDSGPRRKAGRALQKQRVVSNAQVKGERVVPQPTRAPISIPDSAVSVSVPKAHHAKGRRIIVPPDPTLPITAVYMRGDVQFVHQRTRTHIAPFSLPVEKDERRHVVDAHLLDERTIVVGYDRGPAQVSCVVLKGMERPVRVDIKHKGHTTVHEKRHRGTSSPNPGIACIATIPGDERRFLSGGRDGSIRSWRLDEDVMSARGRSRLLALSPEQPIRCIAYRATTTDVLAAHTKHLYVSALDAPKSAVPTLLSAELQQIHVHPQNPNVIVLEVDHLDSQVQIYDTRKSGFDRRPCIEFGYRDTGSSSSSSMKHRWRRGSTRHTLFARGYGDGSLILWDYRQPLNVIKKAKRREDPIVHAVLTGNQIITYGAHMVTFWDINGM